jgi:hypothetical protein
VTLHVRGRYTYGDAQEDIRAYLASHSRRNYPTAHYADATCFCGSNLFQLYVDDKAGAAVRVCEPHQHEHPIGDSAGYLNEAQLEACVCPCGADVFEITAGVALYKESEDVRWLYLGCRCTASGLVGCFADWKNEYTDFNVFLDRI